MKANLVIILAVLLIGGCNSLSRAFVRETLDGVCNEHGQRASGFTYSAPSLKNKKKLDSGAHGSVYDMGDGTAVKKSKLTRNKDIIRAKSELEILQRITGFHDIGGILEDSCIFGMARRDEDQDDPDETEYVLLFFSMRKYGKSLFQLIVSENDYTKQAMWQVDIVIKLTFALERFHSLGLVHRDLKIENTLMAENIKSFSYTPVLIDFDTAIIQGTTDNRACGTPFYVSPEIMSYPNNDVDYASDIYSLGRLFYIIINPDAVAQVDFKKMPGCDKKHKYSIRSHFCESSIGFEKLVLEMTDSRPNRRPSLSQVKERLYQIRSNINAQIPDVEYFRQVSNALITGQRYSKSAGGIISLSKDDKMSMMNEADEGFWSYNYYVYKLVHYMKRDYPDFDHQVWTDFREIHSSVADQMLALVGGRLVI